MELLQLKLALGNKSPSEFPHEYLIAAYIKRKSSWYQDLAISSGKPQEYLILLKTLHFSVRGRRWIFLLSGDTGNCLRFVACRDALNEDKPSQETLSCSMGHPVSKEHKNFMALTHEAAVPRIN